MGMPSGAPNSRQAISMSEHQQPKHTDDLFLITREELDRCCSQMSAAGYKVSANYVEASVLSRPHPPTRDTWPDNFSNPIESDRRGYRCIHCDIDGDAQFCHYHKKQVVTLPYHDTAIARAATLAAKQEMAKDLSAIIQSEWMCDLAEILYIIECVSKGNNETFKESLRHPSDSSESEEAGAKPRKQAGEQE